MFSIEDKSPRAVPIITFLTTQGKSGTTQLAYIEYPNPSITDPRQARFFRFPRRGSQLGMARQIICARRKTPRVPIKKYNLFPYLSTISPKGSENAIADKQIYITAYPAQTWSKQYLFWQYRLALSMKGTQRAAEIEPAIMIIHTLALNCFRSESFIVSSAWPASSAIGWPYTLSTYFQMKKRAKEHTKLMKQKTAPTQNPADKFCELSYITGVRKLLTAPPSSGKVITRPSEVASSFPLNQNETIVICAVISDSQNIPNKALPANMKGKDLAETAIEIMNCAMVTPRDRMTTDALYESTAT